MGSDLYPVIYALILYLMIYVRIAEISCAVFFFFGLYSRDVWTDFCALRLITARVCAVIIRVLF